MSCARSSCALAVTPSVQGKARRRRVFAVILGGVSPGPPKADRNDPVGRFEGDPATQPWALGGAGNVHELLVQDTSGVR